MYIYIFLDKTDTTDEMDTFVAKDKTRSKVPSQHQVAIRNVVRKRTSARRRTNTLSISDTFKKSMSNEIIVRFTNIKVLTYDRDKQIYPNEFSSQLSQLDHTSKKVTGSYKCYKQTIKKRRKTRKSCVLCSKSVCDEHECGNDNSM